MDVCDDIRIVSKLLNNTKLPYLSMTHFLLRLFCISITYSQRDKSASARPRRVQSLVPTYVFPRVDVEGKQDPRSVHREYLVPIKEVSSVRPSELGGKSWPQRLRKHVLSRVLYAIGGMDSMPTRFLFVSGRCGLIHESLLLVRNTGKILRSAIHFYEGYLIF